MKIVLSGMLAAFTLSGCAGMLQSMNQDPFRNVVVRYSTGERKDVATALSLDSSRRIILVGMDPDARNAGKFCAEPPPDTANALENAFKAGLTAKANVKNQAGEGSVNAEDIGRVTPVTIVSSRSAAVDMYRTGVFALCQYYLNGAISGPELIKAFASLTDNVAQKLADAKVVASSDPAASGRAVQQATGDTLKKAPVLESLATPASASPTSTTR
jgi:hypothetical protein